MALGSAYMQWQTALADLLPQEQPSEHERPFTFFIDDDVVVRVLGSTVRSLAGSVRSQLRFPSPNMFERIRRECNTWSSGDGVDPPPSLPLLALTVLAASQMDREVDIRPTNYYLPLSRLLTDSEDDTDEWRHRLAQQFDDVARMWSQLRVWLEARGSLTTMRDHPHYTRIGIPISQAVVRRVDRRILTQFWSLLDVKSSLPNGMEMVSDLRRWVQSDTRGLGRILLETLRDPENDQWLAPVLHELAANWDGEVVTFDGRALGSLTLVSAGPDETPTLEWLAGETPVAFHVSHLENGLEKRIDTMLWKARKRPLVVMNYDPMRNEWTEADSLSIGVRQRFVYPPSSKHAVQSIAESQVSRRSPLVRRFEGASVATLDVLLDADSLQTSAIKLQETLGIKSGLALSRAGRPRTTLEQGLRLTTNLAQHVYVSGGAPSLRYPEGLLGEPVAVELNGIEQHPSPVRDVLPLPLYEVAREPGEYHGVADGSSFRFSVVRDGSKVGGRAAPRPIGLPAKSWVMVTDPPPSSANGAWVPESTTTPELKQAFRTVWVPRDAKRAFLVGPAGQIRTLHTKEPNEIWKTIMGSMTPLVYPVTRTRTEGWLISFTPTFSGQQIRVTQLVPVPPDVSPDLDEESGRIDKTQWISILRQAGQARTCHSPAWIALLKSAQYQHNVPHA